MQKLQSCHAACQWPQDGKANHAIIDLLMGTGELRHKYVEGAEHDLKGLARLSVCISVPTTLLCGAGLQLRHSDHKQTKRNHEQRKRGELGHSCWYETCCLASMTSAGLSLLTSLHATARGHEGWFLIVGFEHLISNCTFLNLGETCSSSSLLFHKSCKNLQGIPF